MRTTLKIDDDVLAAVRQMAAREGKPLGVVVSDLVRRSLTPVQPPRHRNGVPLLRVSPGSHPVTPELVRRLFDEWPE